MNNISLHSNGENDHLHSLKSEYLIKIKEIKENLELSKEVKTEKLEKLKAEFNKQKKRSRFKLF